MNDSHDPPQDSADGPEKLEDQPAAETTPASEDARQPAPETPPGMLPLVEPFFGNRAFLYAALPFVIYFLGTMVGSQFENTRKTEPLHSMGGQCRSLRDDLPGILKQNLTEEEVQSILEEIDFASVSDALDDESSKVEVLVSKCQTLLDTGDFEDRPEAISKLLVQFRLYVEKYLQLKAYEEEGQPEKIRPEYIEFAKVHMPSVELTQNTSWYPALYSIACIAAFVAMLFAMPTYLKKVPFRVSALAVGVGTIGVVLWIALWWLNNEYGFNAGTHRAAFNPFEELKDTPTWMWIFLGIRLLGMVIVIPVAEEFFLRGFLMRYCEDIDWDQIPIGEATWRGWAGIIAYAAFSHVETVAALVWFTMITVMYLKTKNIWDCVIAHAVTNGLLAVYVIVTGTWVLW